MRNLNNIPFEFKDFTSRFLKGLAFHKLRLDEFDKKFAKELKKLTHLKIPVWDEWQSFYQFLTESIQELKSLTQTYTKQINSISSSFLRRSIFPFLMESEFLKRTNLRPNGYPGDAIMMEMIYKNEYLGSSSFGKILHKHPIETKAANSVRNRRTYLTQLFQEIIRKNPTRKLKVLSVACGPAWEVWDFFLNTPNFQIEFYLLDQDKEAILRAKERIESIENGKYLKQCKFVNESIKIFLQAKSSIQDIGNFDFIYSMGLYDYLNERLAKRLTEKLYSILNETGNLVIGNYHKKNETKEYMEYIMDWILKYRTEEDMYTLTYDLKTPSSVSIEFENSKTQMFMKIQK